MESQRLRRGTTDRPDKPGEPRKNFHPGQADPEAEQGERDGNKRYDQTTDSRTEAATDRNSSQNDADRSTKNGFSESAKAGNTRWKFRIKPYLFLQGLGVKLHNQLIYEHGPKA